MTNVTGIRQIDLSQMDNQAFKQQLAGCIVLTHDGRILLQYRPQNWWTCPDMIATFGGHIEGTETPSQGIIRELLEELGAKVNQSDLIELGTITEEATQYTDLVYIFFWHDKRSSITGCYECEAQYFDNVAEALNDPKLMSDVRWALLECQNKKLLV